MNDYTSEQCMQDILVTLLDAFDDKTGELPRPLSVAQQSHYFLILLSCLVHELNAIDGRPINLNTELHNIRNTLKERGHE
ncbi:hypothetical protein [Endozoicomonas sp. SESOKO1]|uniref:hypothetical protein n=1 Tax=Endozoicomonas sp. SESOKO1 TaxID=2828742 RepID=UPI002148DE10|nr:hypothetical protein [Endozoicomonas sp. SESOKO1]